MEMPYTEPEAIKPRPDYPPRTPPPPKKPPSPPPPEPPRSELLAGLPVPQRAGRVGHPVMRNRRGASWSLEARPWVAAKAAREVAGRLAAWGFVTPRHLDDVVRLVVETVVEDGGRRVSVHLSEQDDRALILGFSHQAAAPGAPLAETVLPALRDFGTDSCGTEVTSEGRQVWALLALTAAPRRSR
ncbi:hypothetical protein ACIQKE_12175 [Streptomyces griseoviridis]|nr:hypothetical protein [Streptomyces griseoviridis]MDH6695636.1 hypothetical protein [Streptomyces sp. MAA16]